MNVLHRYAVSATVLGCIASFSTFAADPPPARPQVLASPDLITLADATRMAQAALDACARLGQPTSVLVMDAAGFQRVAYSDDNAKQIGVLHTRLKAAAVLEFKVSTQALAARVQTDKQFADQYGKDERYLLQAGGLPVYKSGKLVAVISVGGSGDANEACAQAGVKALSWAGTAP